MKLISDDEKQLSSFHVWSAKDGGLSSQNSYYPGHRQQAEKNKYDLFPSQLACLHLSQDDLLELDFSAGQGTLLMAAVDLENQPFIPSFADALALLNSEEQKRDIAQRFDHRALSPLLEAWQLDLQQLHFFEYHKVGQGLEATVSATAQVLQAEGDYRLIIAFAASTSDVVMNLLAAPLNGAKNTYKKIDSLGSSGTLSIQHLAYKKASADPAMNLPDPLGKIRGEITVPRASARAYPVAKGEYIQVIDVQGRQCSDFMAINSAALAQGEERFIDGTVTRSLAGGAYPQPGLHDKFFDQDMQPLLAVVQDTVGRHDTFALACTEYGYAERGFPGHLNCSDNISAAYLPYGIKPKRAWPAINFFFNSWIDTHSNRLGIDESWSRAGDYVLMQALTDLICVSTACPDDIDPINGWNPTEIHVRIYPSDLSVNRSIAYRSLPESVPFMSIETPFHPRTRELTQRFTNARQHWVPQAYDATGAIAEYWACRQSVTVQDMTNLRKIDITGPDAERLLQLALTRDISKLSVHRGYYALLCSQQGAVIDDGTLFRLAPELFRWCCGSDESARQLAEIAQQHNLKVWVRDMSLQLCNLAVQGPRSRELLQRFVFTQPSQPQLENIKWFGCAIARVNDRQGIPFMLTRSGFTGELGYELFCDQRDAVALWDVIEAAGKEFGLKPMGNDALEMLRVEAGLMISGAEFGAQIEPDEAGLGFAIDMGNTEFQGRSAIERHRIAPRHTLVGLTIEGGEVPHHGATVFLHRQPVGMITSAVKSPELKTVIAMARISVELSGSGQQLEIGCLDGHIKRLYASVQPLPFIDPQRVKARS